MTSKRDEISIKYYGEKFRDLCPDRRRVVTQVIGGLNENSKKS